MKVLVFICFALLLFCSFGDARRHRAGSGSAAKTVRHSGLSKHCIGGKEYELVYDVTIPENAQFTRLEDVKGLKTVTCDVSDTHLVLSFSNSSTMDSFLKGLKLVEGFVTAGTEFKCHNNSIIRRVLDYTTQKHNTVSLHAIVAKYDEIFENATINFGASSGNVMCTVPEADKTVCLGVNTDKKCDSAAGPIVLFKNKYLSVSCSDCYLALEADIFISIHLVWSSMSSFSGGFKNINILGAFVLDMLAHSSWSAAVDTISDIVDPTTAVSFWVGPVPIDITFEIPLEQVMSANFEATAEAIVGVKMDWNIGDWYVAWDWESGWSHSSPKPKLNWTPVLSGPASFQADASVGLIPSFKVMVDNFFTTKYALNPAVMLAANGSALTDQLCVNMGYDIDLTIEAQLYIGLPWYSLHREYTYGPKVMWDTGKQNIGQFCIKA